MVFIALPEDADDSVEDWFSAQLHEMTRQGSDNFMKALPEISKEIHAKIKDEEMNGRSNVYLKIQVPKRPVLRHQMFMWYAPVVVMNVVKASQRGRRMLSIQYHRGDIQHALRIKIRIRECGYCSMLC